MKRNLLCLMAVAIVTAASGQQMTKADTHSPYLTTVDEYAPAPGQFVNMLPAYKAGDTADSMAVKCTKALANNNKGMITLGAYGGYVTFHFDHSIANVKGKADLYIAGNGFKGSSEPGIVMVSKDVNMNGIADDPWYELAGSADVDSVGKVKYNYQITYTIDSLKDTPWKDNQGDTGVVARNNFHKQEYFPLWMNSPLTFKGTLLPKNAHDTSGNGTYWVLESFRYGYVDNALISDTAACSFNIEWAVDENRKPVDIDFVDFVRVYNGENQMAGWLGETSTEVTNAMDMHLNESVAAIQAVAEADAKTATFEEMALNTESFWNGSDMKGKEEKDAYGTSTYHNTFVSGSYRFNNNYSPAYGGYWSGFAVSNQTATTFSNYADQYHSATGKGVDDSNNFAVVYPYGQTIDVLFKEDGDIIRGFYLTNSANDVNAYLNGDGMTTGSFKTGDWCKLTITGTHADGTTATVDAYLADYRSENETEHYYLNTWKWVDLTTLGKVTKVSFAMTSSRNNDYGMTTPTYFCMDNFNGTPTTNDIQHPANASNATETARYALDGKRLNAPQKGVNIIRMSDGTTRKVIVR